MDNNDTATQRPRFPDGIFHLHNPTAAENGEGCNFTAAAEDVAPDENLNAYRLVLKVDTHVWGWVDEEEEPERLARFVMNSDSARKLARQLTAAAAELDQLNGVHAGSREALGKYLESLNADIYVEYDEADSLYRWGDLKSILH